MNQARANGTTPATASKVDHGRIQQYLTFTLRGDLYGIDILNIKEIIEYGGVTAVPRMPPCVSGIINLRGAVVPVVDLGRRFSHKRSEITPKTCIVIAEIEEAGTATEIGIIVDAVNEVLDISQNDTEPPPAFGGRIRQDFIATIAKVNGHFVIVLNVHKVLDIDEITELNESLAAPEAVAEEA